MWETMLSVFWAFPLFMGMYRKMLIYLFLLFTYTFTNKHMWSCLHTCGILLSRNRGNNGDNKQLFKGIDSDKNKKHEGLIIEEKLRNQCSHSVFQSHKLNRPSEALSLWLLLHFHFFCLFCSFFGGSFLLYEII